ncbi:hypothetical protein RCH10_005544 [Variovorax sp. GrIS 2.14]
MVSMKRDHLHCIFVRQERTPDPVDKMRKGFDVKLVQMLTRGVALRMTTQASKYLDREYMEHWEAVCCLRIQYSDLTRTWLSITEWPKAS